MNLLGSQTVYLVMVQLVRETVLVSESGEN